MAFRQPIVAPRRLDPLQEPQYNGPTIQVSTQQTAHDESSREWVLFPPSQAYSTSQTRTTFTARTPRTAGHSRISDFGSIGITAHSDGNERDLARDGDEGAREEEEEEEELDSLDEGLHAFHDPTVDRYTRFLGRSGTILPTHDGLGMFPPSSLQVQEQLWQFEQRNPRKRMADTPLLSPSLRRHLESTADADETKLDSERRQRIENWRIDQARLLLDEIEKQSRRKRWSQSGGGERDPGDSAGRVARGVESPVGDSMHQHVGGVESSGGGDGGDNQQESSPKETLLEGITRRLCDLLGIDEFLLSIIFGDALPVDENPSSSRLASLSLPELLDDSSSSSSCPNRPTESSLLPEWHGRLLDRLTRELGFFIQRHLSEHPGAFSAHLQLRGSGSDAPMPSPPLTPPPPYSSPPLDQEQPEKSLALHDFENSSSSLSPHFSPTLPVQAGVPAAAASSTTTTKSEATHAALWGVEEEGNHFRLASISEERAYWERTPDVKSIFRLLHTRFTAQNEQQWQQQQQQQQQQPQPSSPNSNPNPNPTPNKNIPTTSSTLASLRRASVIYQHHPLVSKRDNSGRRTRNSLLNHLHHHHQLLHNHHHHHHHNHHSHSHHHHHHHHHHPPPPRPIFSLRRATTAAGGGGGGNSPSTGYSYSYSCASSNLLKRSKSKSGSSSRNYWDLDV